MLRKLDAAGGKPGIVRKTHEKSRRGPDIKKCPCSFQGIADELEIFLERGDHRLFVRIVIHVSETALGSGEIIFLIDTARRGDRMDKHKTAGAATEDLVAILRAEQHHVAPLAHVARDHMPRIRLRKRRSGVISPSRMIWGDIFDSPPRRVLKMIGISTTEAPASRIAWYF